jgi:hypothetical protein
MTQSIHFIGDSHTIPLYNAFLCFTRNPIENENTIIQPYPQEEYRVTYDKKNDVEYHFHSRPGRAAHNIDYNNLNFSKQIKSGDKVIAYLGECDIRIYLPKYKNTKEIVEAYVHNTKNHFKDNPIFFLTPVPPIDQSYGVSKDDPDTMQRINYWSEPEDRLTEYKIFMDHLSKMCIELSLPAPIDISFGQEYLSSIHRDSDMVLARTEHGKKMAKEIMKRSDLYN